MAAIIALTLLVILVFPSVSFAWGPATHLEVGQAVLANPVLLTGSARMLLERFPYDFLYGNVSADIIVGKNLVEELKHCHNWKIGLRLMRKAGSDSQRAFAYGYLCHLAADTVAHNHFIPERMIRTFSARMLRHIYWEMRFDALADKRVWNLPRRIVKSIHADNDALLDSIIEDAPLSFTTNKTIFSSIMSLHRFEKWHTMLRVLSSASRWPLHGEDRERYLNASVEAAIGLLNLGHRAPCLKKDPTGRESIRSALSVRRELLRKRRSGKDWQGAMEEALDSVAMG